MLDIIIAGLMVLTLAILGIAKLAGGRGGGGGAANVDDIVSMASNAEKAMLTALYKDPTKIPEAMQYMRQVAGASKGAMSALYKGVQMTRERVDAAVERRNMPAEDRIDYLDGLLEINKVTNTAFAKYREKKIGFDQARSYVAKEIATQRESFKRHYGLRHAGMA